MARTFRNLPNENLDPHRRAEEITVLTGPARPHRRGTLIPGQPADPGTRAAGSAHRLHAGNPVPGAGLRGASLGPRGRLQAAAPRLPLEVPSLCEDRAPLALRGRAQTEARGPQVVVGARRRGPRLPQEGRPPQAGQVGRGRDSSPMAAPWATYTGNGLATSTTNKQRQQHVEGDTLGASLLFTVKFESRKSAHRKRLRPSALEPPPRRCRVSLLRGGVWRGLSRRSVSGDGCASCRTGGSCPQTGRVSWTAPTAPHRSPSSCGRARLGPTPSQGPIRGPWAAAGCTNALRCRL